MPRHQEEPARPFLPPSHWRRGGQRGLPILAPSLAGPHWLPQGPDPWSCCPCLGRPALRPRFLQPRQLSWAAACEDIDGDLLLTGIASLLLHPKTTGKFLHCLIAGAGRTKQETSAQPSQLALLEANCQASHLPSMLEVGRAFPRKAPQGPLRFLPEGRQAHPRSPAVQRHRCAGPDIEALHGDSESHLRNRAEGGVAEAAAPES